MRRQALETVHGHLGVLMRAERLETLTASPLNGRGTVVRDYVRSGGNRTPDARRRRIYSPLRLPTVGTLACAGLPTRAYVTQTVPHLDAQATWLSVSGPQGRSQRRGESNTRHAASNGRRCLPQFVRLHILRLATSARSALAVPFPRLAATMLYALFAYRLGSMTVSTKKLTFRQLRQQINKTCIPSCRHIKRFFAGVNVVELQSVLAATLYALVAEHNQSFVTGPCVPDPIVITSIPCSSDYDPPQNTRGSWHAWRESNSRASVLETGPLPLAQA